MPTIEEYIYTRIQSALESIPADQRADVYVVSLFLYDEDDDPRRPTITVGINTESNAAAMDDMGEGDETRWNYAFFPQNELDVLFRSTSDPDGVSVRDRLMSAAGYTFPNDDATARVVTTPWFVANTVFAARRLHDNGDITRVFGRPIPIIVHELEYYDQIAMQNLAANPPGVADEFIRWCRSG